MVDIESGDCVKTPTSSSYVKPELVRRTTALYTEGVGLEGGQELKQHFTQVDPSLVFSMERTYFSATNQAILILFAGFGLMSVQTGLQEPHTFGIFLAIAGCTYGTLAWVMHVWRMKRMERGLGIANDDSVYYTGLLNVLVLVGGIAQIYYGMKHPFLERSQTVDIAQ